MSKVYGQKHFTETIAHSLGFYLPFNPIGYLQCGPIIKRSIVSQIPSMPLHGWPMYHHRTNSTEETGAQYKSEFKLTKYTQYLVLMGKLWIVYCDALGNIDWAITAPHCTHTNQTIGHPYGRGTQWFTFTSAVIHTPPRYEWPCKNKTRLDIDRWDIELNYFAQICIMYVMDVLFELWLRVSKQN